jgi:hypothetical protein
MIRLVIKESISNGRRNTRISIRLNNPLLRQSPFQYVWYNCVSYVAIQHLKCHSKSSSPLQESWSRWDLPTDQQNLYFPKQIEIKWRDIRGIRRMREPLQLVAPHTILSYPWERLHCQCALPAFFALHSMKSGRMSQVDGPSFHQWTMLHWRKFSDEAFQRHGTRGDFIKQSAYLSGRNGPVFDFRLVFIQCCPCRSWMY